MRKPFCLLLSLALTLAAASHAHEGDLARMRSVAVDALAAKQLLPNGARGSMGVADAAQVKELRALDHCALIGYEGGAYVVVSATDSPRVLGVCTSQPSPQGENPGFEAWLRAVDEVVGQARAGALALDPSKPNLKKFPQEVKPLLTTHWGQKEPYWNLLPLDSLGARCATGCVATSMAQVLNYYKKPVHGTGQGVSVYPYSNPYNYPETRIEVDFENTNYRWDLMLDDYSTQAYTAEQAEAVATLMMHCGVASDMHYGGESVGGSGTTEAAAAYGLVDHFGMTDAQCVYRDAFSKAEWMDMVFGELSTGHPLMYGGQEGNGGGHSFVLHGYDRNGLVYVNWGWNGSEEGYYDIALLDPGRYSFFLKQDMIIGVNATVIDLANVDVTLSAAGELTNLLPADASTNVDTLKVSGPLNGTDLKLLRQVVAAGNVKLLDLADARFVSGGDPYLTEGRSTKYRTEDDVLPYKAFYGCDKLKAIRLPRGLKGFGNGALGGCRFLEEIDLLENSNADFVRDGHLIYNKEKTELICALTTVGTELRVPDGITTLRPYAFAGCVQLMSVNLPSSVATLGAGAFSDCLSLSEIHLHNRAMTASADSFEGVDLTNCTLYVPSATKEYYSRRAGFQDFKTMVEVGTTVRAQNAIREYGQENPTFGYEILGEPVQGVPELYTDATVTSPPGEYVIYVTAGTIASSEVEYENGRLIITEPTAVSPVTGSAAPATVYYDLSGRRVSRDASERGVYLERQADGRVVKRIKQ